MSLWGGTSWLAAVGRLFRQGVPQTAWAWDDRAAMYALWDAYYANTVYERTAAGGQRDAINAELGNAAAADLQGLYNPVAQVVDLYLHVFSGAFGDEIQVEPLGQSQAAQASQSPSPPQPARADQPPNAGLASTPPQPQQRTPAPPSSPLVEAITQIWQWSNLTVEKQPLCRLAATHGCVGLRIVARDDDDDGRKRVYIKPEHPRTIRDARLDDRGNVEAIQLEYELTIGLAEAAKVITIREELTKSRIRTWRVQGSILTPFDLLAFSADGMPVELVDQYNNGPGADYENALGVVPYVILRHEHIGDAWGRNAFYKARAPIDRLNSLVCHTDVQVHRHVRATWLVAAAGAAPQQFVFDDLKVIYIDTRSQTTNPMTQAMVADLDLEGARKQAELQIGLIEDMLPELKAVGGKFLANQSGETIAELRKPAEDAVLLARANYEAALVKAQQIAVSWGILLGLWNLGTGTGSCEAAERAFREGKEDHRFNKRPALGEEKKPQPAQLIAPGMMEQVPEQEQSRNGRAPGQQLNGNGVIAGGQNGQSAAR